MTLELRCMRLPLSEPERVAALAVLSAAEVERYATASEPDGFIAGRFLLRTLVAELTDGLPADVVLDASCPDCLRQHGKVTAPGSGMHLSVSHSPGVVVVAVADAPIGVDVEGEPSAEALAAIGVVAGEASIDRWTRVEAVLKADGRGLRVDPRLVVIDGDIAWIDGAPERYRLSDVELAPGIHAVVAYFFRR